MMTHNEVLKKARIIHDQIGCGCDPKYLMSCPNMAAAILRAGKDDSEVRLTSGEFIQKLRTAPMWTLSKSREETGVFKLRVFEGDEIRIYLSPVPLSMKDSPHYRAFINTLKMTSRDPMVDERRLL